MADWLTVREAAEREGISKPGMMKRIRRFEQTRDPARLAPYADVCQDDRGRYLLLLPDSQPETLEVVDDAPTLPAIPTPDTTELAQRLAAIGELLERQQATIEWLAAIVEAQGRQAAERDRAREQAAEARAERIERELAEWRRERETAPVEKKPWWKRW